MVGMGCVLNGKMCQNVAYTGASKEASIKKLARHLHRTIYIMLSSDML